MRYIPMLAMLALLLAACPAPPPPRQGTVSHMQEPAKEMTEETLVSASSEVTTTFTAEELDNEIFILAPAVRPERFVDCIDNPYYPMIPGTVYEYESETEDGLETVVVTVTNQTKDIMGITTTVLHDTERLDGELVEDTYDWYAQDKDGNVWYFGEDTQKYEDGEIVSTAGAWEAGVDGAVPGIIMLAHPTVGDVYREEYYEGEATDIGGIMSSTDAVSVAFGDFEGALQTAAYNPLDSELEQKWYVPGLGLTKEMVPESGVSVELVNVRHDSSMIMTDTTCGADNQGVSWVGTLPVSGSPDNLQDLAQIDSGEAEQAVMDAQPNATISETALEVENGFLVYKIMLDSGERVAVDAGDGVLLAIEAGDG